MNLSLFQLSPTTRYALSGMGYIARQPANHYALVDEVAQAEKLPKHFLAKIFQLLAQRGLLLSRRGPGGGYALAQAPERMSLLQVLSAIEPASNSTFCFMENRNCDKDHPCVMHPAVVAAGDLLSDALQKMTLADLDGSQGKSHGDNFHV